MSTDTAATPERPRFLLAPEVWLALGMEAEHHGGVGASSLYDGDQPRGCPVCLYGLAGSLDGLTESKLADVVYSGRAPKTPTVQALVAAGIEWDHSDDAVQAARRGSWDAPVRVSWEEFATRLGLGIKGVDDVGE